MTFTDLKDAAFFPDKTLVCMDCGDEFVWRGGEQKYYLERELSEPKRCRGCRADKREQRERELSS